MSTETVQLIRDGKKAGAGVWRMERGGEGDCIPIATLSQNYFCIKWAVVRAILMFQ